MRIGYFDCFSGASGDMILGSLVGAGVSVEALRGELAKLNLPGWKLQAEQVRKQGFRATQVRIDVQEESPPHRHLGTITNIIDASTLPEGVRARAKRVFTRLAEAEAKVHGATIESVHFHEVGAVDAIIDIVGACIGIDLLGLDRIVCSPIPTGSGSVQCEHGLMPVPAPATAELLRGVPIAASEEMGELTTPTGAAILTTLAETFGTMPAMCLGEVGCGAGERDGQTRPNVLRLLIGEAQTEGASVDQITVLEANLDDMSGECTAYATEALFNVGALDVFTTSIQMKKNRPGVLLTVLASEDCAAACEAILFSETSTFGVRRYVCERAKLERETITVSTSFGVLRVKIGRREGRITSISPEYEDCAEAARKHGVPLRDVMLAARRAWKGPDGYAQ